MLNYCLIHSHVCTFSNRLWKWPNGAVPPAVLVGSVAAKPVVQARYTHGTRGRSFKDGGLTGTTEQVGLDWKRIK